MLTIALWCVLVFLVGSDIHDFEGLRLALNSAALTLISAALVFKHITNSAKKDGDK